MARLERGERQRRRRTIRQFIWGRYGVKESEIAQGTGLDRRVVNNYLRELDQNGEVHKKGWYWYRG